MSISLDSIRDPLNLLRGKFQSTSSINILGYRLPSADWCFFFSFHLKQARRKQTVAVTFLYVLNPFFGECMGGAYSFFFIRLLVHNIK